MSADEFLLADPVFFESVDRARQDRRFEVADRPAPAGWSRLERGSWVGLQPGGAPLPQHGWKIHLSTTEEHAERSLRLLWDYCVEHGVAFKTLASPALHRIGNGKGAHRGASGKLAAVYPVGEACLAQTLAGLGELLAGVPGPYVLSDLRVGRGPLYVRFGSFLEAWGTSPLTGEPVPCLVRPDGVRVPDERRAVFAVPDWAPLPEVVRRERDAAADVVAGELGYRVERALQHSNAGGVYLARDAHGTPVVLKEARPHAGLDFAGEDAVARLDREAAALERMGGTGVLPELLGRLELWEHQFLVVEHIDGETLHERLAHAYPYLYPDPSAEELAAHTAWALGVLDRVEALLETLHEHGLVYADLHPGNVMLTPDGGVRLVDAELAFDIADEAHHVPLGEPGSRHATLADGGRRIDDYALACLRLLVFLPVTSLFYWDRDLAPGGTMERLAHQVTRLFPLPAGYAARVVADLRRAAGDRLGTLPALPGVDVRADDHDDPARWPALLAQGVLAAATPDRDDRLYPYDLGGFRYGGVGLAHGAAGVLHALHQTQPDAVPDRHVGWLADHALADISPWTGLYDGSLGAAVVLAALGHGDAALEVLDRATPRMTLNASCDLFGGAAGRGLAGLRLFGLTGCPDAWRLVEQSAQGLTRVLRPGPGVPPPGADELVAPRPGGLMRGWSGPALFLLRLFEVTRQADHLRLAVDAVERDLARCRAGERGSLLLGDDAGRVLLYLSSGSIGVGLVLRELMPHLRGRPDAVAPERVAALEAALAAIRHTCRTTFTMFGGLFEGRAGVLAGAVLLDDTAPDRTLDDTVAAHVGDLGRHLVGYRGGLALAGTGMIRLSTDLAAGSAGAMLALRVAAADGTTADGTAPDLLPALGLRPPTAHQPPHQSPHRTPARLTAPAPAVPTTRGGGEHPCRS